MSADWTDLFGLDHQIDLVTGYVMVVCSKIACGHACAFEASQDVKSILDEWRCRGEQYDAWFNDIANQLCFGERWGLCSLNVLMTPATTMRIVVG